MKIRKVERLGYTVADVLAAGAFPTRNKVYAAIAAGEIQTWKDGRTRMISAASVARYIEQKIAAADGRGRA